MLTASASQEREQIAFDSATLNDNFRKGRAQQGLERELTREL